MTAKFSADSARLHRSLLIELDELISDAGAGDAAVVTVARRRDGALVPVDAGYTAM